VAIEVVPALPLIDEEGILGDSVGAVARVGDFLMSLCDLRTVGRTLALVRASVDWILAFSCPSATNCSAKTGVAIERMEIWTVRTEKKR
jgi:hypothetical protein